MYVPMVKSNGGYIEMNKVVLQECALEVVTNKSEVLRLKSLVDQTQFLSPLDSPLLPWPPAHSEGPRRPLFVHWTELVS